jgi:hypothetical protein
LHMQGCGKKPRNLVIDRQTEHIGHHCVNYMRCWSLGELLAQKGATSTRCCQAFATQGFQVPSTCAVTAPVRTVCKNKQKPPAAPISSDGVPRLGSPLLGAGSTRLCHQRDCLAHRRCHPCCQRPLSLPPPPQDMYPLVHENACVVTPIAYSLALSALLKLEPEVCKCMRYSKGCVLPTPLRRYVAADEGFRRPLYVQCGFDSG